MSSVICLSLTQARALIVSHIHGTPQFALRAELLLSLPLGTQVTSSLSQSPPPLSHKPVPYSSDRALHPKTLICLTDGAPTLEWRHTQKGQSRSHYEKRGRIRDTSCRTLLHVRSNSPCSRGNKTQIQQLLPAHRGRRSWGSWRPMSNLWPAPPHAGNCESGRTPMICPVTQFVARRRTGSSSAG